MFTTVPPIQTFPLKSPTGSEIAQTTLVVNDASSFLCAAECRKMLTRRTPEEVFGTEMRTAHFHRLCDGLSDAQLHNPLLLESDVKGKRVEACGPFNRIIGALGYTAHSVALMLFGAHNVK